MTGGVTSIRAETVVNGLRKGRMWKLSLEYTYILSAPSDNYLINTRLYRFSAELQAHSRRFTSFQHLTAGIPTAGFSGHSIRQGAVVTAAARGISREDIKLMSR
jgi:hypothetical protein